jgi:glycosyltransferase involved in cell wall biosynthesis
MKLLELCLSTGVGGLELYAVRTAAALSARGIRVQALVSAGTMTAERMESDNIPTTRWAGPAGPLPLIAARRLAGLIERERIDILHMHWNRDLRLVALAKWLCRRPFQVVYTRQMMLTRPKHDRYHRFVYGQVDAFIAITRQLEALAVDLLPMPRARIRTLYYGVDAPPVPLAQERAQLRASLGLREEAFVVGMVGRIEAGKGQHLVVEAAARLAQAGVDVQVLVVGPAMDEGYLSDLRAEVSERGLDARVVFHGPHREPSRIMPCFDALVLASREETFGLVLIEAMRGDVAVIGTDAGGVPEIITDGETGLLFPPDDAPALADRLLRLARDPDLRARLAQAGKASADARFSREQHYAGLLALFEELAGGPLAQG